MVHLGPSTACKKCRERHVRCDKQKPTCKRCTSIGHTCPGYRDVCGVVFKDVSVSVFEQQSRRATRKSLQRPIAYHMPCAALKELELDPEIACIFFFTQNYIMTPERDPLISRGHFEYLIPLYSSAAPSSPLALATLVVAGRALNMYYGNTQTSSWHIKNELSASQAIKKAISDPVESTRDETLLAVLCLDFAEHLSSVAAVKSLTKAHMDGAVALAKLRKPADFSSTVSQSLLAATRSNALLQALCSHDERSQDAAALLPNLGVMRGTSGVALHQILARVLKLETMMTTSAPDTGATSAKNLDSDLLDWCKCFLPEWEAMITPSPFIGTSFTRAIVQGLPSMQMAQVSGQWRCTKLMVLKFLYDASFPASSEIPSRASMLPRIRDEALEVVNGLCSIQPCFSRGSEVLINGKAIAESATKRLGSGHAPAPPARGYIYVGGSGGRRYLLNNLSWVLTTLTAMLPEAHAFTAQSDTMTYLRDEHRMSLIGR